MSSDDSPKSEQPLPATGLPVYSTQPNPDLHPDLDQVKSVTLKDGPRVKKVASHTVILNRHTGEVHHDAVTIKTLRKREGQFNLDVAHSITLESEHEDEIQRLTDFLLAARSGAVPKKSGQFVVVASPVGGGDGQALQKVLNDLTAAGKADLLADVLGKSAKDPKLLQALLQRAAKDPALFAEAAAALNMARYQQAVNMLMELIKTSDKEHDFQKLLSQNPWMFGSEYSEVLDRRKWTRDEQQDFVVRRTADGYIELIEIKTPLRDTQLFRFDESHKSFYAGSELSKVVGQVANYIEKLDACRDMILANDNEDTCKIRAKIIIGLDGPSDQRKALRRFNAHLNRIEVITFNQLHKIATNVVTYIGSALQPSNDAVAMPAGVPR